MTLISRLTHNLRWLVYFCVGLCVAFLPAYIGSEVPSASAATKPVIIRVASHTSSQSLPTMPRPLSGSALTHLEQNYYQ